MKSIAWADLYEYMLVNEHSCLFRGDSVTLLYLLRKQRGNDLGPYVLFYLKVSRVLLMVQNKFSWNSNEVKFHRPQKLKNMCKGDSVTHGIDHLLFPDHHLWFCRLLLDETGNLSLCFSCSEHCLFLSRCLWYYFYAFKVFLIKIFLSFSAAFLENSWEIFKFSLKYVILWGAGISA